MDDSSLEQAHSVEAVQLLDLDQGESVQFVVQRAEAVSVDSLSGLADGVVDAGCCVIFHE